MHACAAHALKNPVGCLNTHTKKKYVLNTYFIRGDESRSLLCAEEGDVPTSPSPA